MPDPVEQETRSREPAVTDAADVAAVWGAALSAVHCPHCGAAHLAPADAIPPLCPLCLQGPVVPQPAYLRDEPPELVLPYAVSNRQLAGLLERWGEGVRFRPADLKADVMVGRARPYLAPLWLVDGRIAGPWRAEVGFDYEVISHQDRYSQGAGWQSQEVTETRVRWEPRLGSLNRSYENLVVPALDDHRALIDRLGDFDLDQRTAYTPEAVADGAVRIPTVEPEAAWPDARTAFVRAAEADCRRAAGADHIRGFGIEATYDGLHWTQLLMPAYATWYREGDRVWPVFVNGQNGRVSGIRRASTRRANTTSLVLGAVAVLMFLMGGLLALAGMALPPVGVVGALLLVAGLILAAIAPIPAISAWVFNRQSTQWAESLRR